MNMSDTEKKYSWNYAGDKYTLLEYLKKVNELIDSPVNQMQECDGDLFMSEYQKLSTASYKLPNLIDQLEKEQKEYENDV
jgi:hypothetical protein